MRERVVALIALICACGARSSLDDDSTKDAAAPPVDATTPDVGVLPDVIVADVLQPGPVATPRQIAPLSTSSVTTQRPTFHWQLPAGVAGARVEICSSRDCSTIEATLDAIGEHGAPTSALTPGVHFYRLHGIAGNLVGTVTSPTFEFIVPHRSSPRDASWGTFPDVDGDGFADAVVAGDVNGAATFTVFPGSTSGVHHKVRVDVIVPIAEDVISLASAGDVDGDGYADVVVSTDGGIFVYRGGPGGIVANQKPSFTIPASENDADHFFYTVTSAGDVNGDGYADIIVVDRASADQVITRLFIYFGSAQGLSATPSITLDGDDGNFSVGAGEAGDVDGDGFPDIVASGGPSGGQLYLFRGTASGPSTATRTLLATLSDDCAAVPLSPTPGDVNGDGFADIAMTGIGTCGSNNNDTGDAVILYGGATISSPAKLPVPKDYVGFDATIQLAGDIDGDGYDDLVAGLIASLATGDAGVAFFGSPTGFALAASSLVAIPAPASGLGWTFGAGDLDRDGRADVLLFGDGSFVRVFRGVTNGVAAETEVGPLANGEFIAAFR